MSRNLSRWRQVTTIHSFKNSKIVRVFGIVRVSTDKQAKKIGESLDHQKEVLNNWVRSKSSLHAPQEWKLIDIFVENEDQDGNRKGRTATKREGRRGLAKALELAKLKMVDVVVVTKLDRIARNVKDYIDISAEFNESGVALVCLDLDIDTSTPDGQMIMRNHANLAQWQAERIAQYSIETIHRHIEQGRPIGPPPIGYIKSKDHNSKTTMIPDPEFRKHIVFIDKTYLQVKSVTKVVDMLHKKGYRSRRNKTYTKAQVSRILQNIRYTGRQDYEGKIYDGNWEPLRELEMQKMIDAILTKNRLSKHNQDGTNKRYVYLAQTVLKCSQCGSSMIARPATGRGGKYYPYYMCMKAYKTHGIDCEMVYLSAEAVDNALIEILRQLRLDPKIVTKIVHDANQSTASTLVTLEQDLVRVRESLKIVKGKLSNLVEVLADRGMASVEALKQKIEVLNQEEYELSLEENRLKQEIEAEKIQAGTAHEYIKTLQLFNDFYVMNGGNMEKIKIIIPRLINSVMCAITDKKKGIGKLKIGLFGRPFDRGENAEQWNEALNKIADECYNKKVLNELNGKLSVKPHTKSLAKIPLEKGSSGSVSYSDKRYYNDSHVDRSVGHLGPQFIVSYCS